MIFFMVLVAIAAILYYYIRWNYTYWEKRKVPGPKPTFLIGNIGSNLNFSEHWGVITAKWYKDYTDVPYIGFYKMLRPCVLVRDADLCKKIMIQEFQSFEKNDVNISKKYDPLFAENPFFNVGDEWRTKRKELLPAFSSSKLKNLMSVMNAVAKEMNIFIKKHAQNIDCNAKELSVKFTTQNVMKSTFSIDARCFNVDEKSEFLKAGEAMFAPSFWVGIKFYIATMFPGWALDYIPVSLVSEETDKLFRKLVSDNKKSRRRHQTNDILQILMQVEEKADSKSDIFLAGHVISLFIDGTETSSIALSYTLYELAINPQCQDKLYDEIIEVVNKAGKEDDVDVTAMPYLDGVLLEAMRIHPPLLVLQKICTKSYELPKTPYQTKPVTISPGTPVHIPVQALHMDERYYPNPEEFRPERFMGEELQNRHKGTYMAFGEGPRACVGYRFAMAQMKYALIYIVKNYYIRLSQNHKPIKIDPETWLSYPKDGILVKFKPR